MSHLTRVGVLRGGPSSEYEISLMSGAAVLTALRAHHDSRYRVHDILIDREGQWHMDGVRVSPHDLAHRLDVVFNALHGTYGEDGSVQSILEVHQIPFTGTGSLGSAVGMNKVLTKQVLEKHGVKSPYWKQVDSSEVSEDASGVAGSLFNSFPMPAVVKPVSNGSSVGVSIARTKAELVAALIDAAKHDRAVLIEEFIPGIETTCGVVERFRGHELYALPPIEIRSRTAFFDYEAKYQGKSEEIVPATFSHELKEEIMRLSRQIHEAVGLRHYSRSDFIIHPKRGVYALEVNTLPGLTGESLIPKALRAVGSDLHELIDHLIGLALKRAKD